MSPRGSVPLVCQREYAYVVLFRVAAIADNDRGPRYAEGVLNSLHEINRQQEAVCLELSSHQGTVGLFVRVPAELVATFTHDFADTYPGCTLSEMPNEVWNTTVQVWSATLRLSTDVFPLKTHRHFEDLLHRELTDPLAGLLAALRGRANDLSEARIALVIRPCRASWYRTAAKVVARIERGFRWPRLAQWYATRSRSQSRLVRAMAWIVGRLARHAESPREVADARDKLSRHLFETHIVLSVSCAEDKTKLARDALNQLVGAFGRFTSHRVAFGVSKLRRGIPKRNGRGFLLSAEELATLWHPPTANVRAAKLRTAPFRELEPPIKLPAKEPEPGVTLLGRVKFRGERQRFGIRLDDRRRHLYVVGKTGMGKSTLLLNMLVDDIQSRRGVCLVDPHGDLSEALLELIPKHRTNDVILFDAADREHPVAFNPLACREVSQRPLVADGVLTVLKRQFGEFFGPRMEDILRNSLLALLESPGSTLVSLQRLLTDAGFRKSITGRVTDPAVRHFWLSTFASWNARYRVEAIAPVENKIRQFLSNPILRAIIGQSRSTIDLRAIMDRGDAILIVNLSKGRLGDEISRLLGSLLVSSLQLAAMSRAEVPEADRPDFCITIDEFQNFVCDGNGTFATILSESRKYRTPFVLSHQFLDQLDDATRAAVFGNVGSMLCFQVGAEDAEILAKQLGADATEYDLMNLPKFTAYLRLLIDGLPSRPFSMTTLEPAKIRQHRVDAIRRVSRQQFGRPIALVERELQLAYET